MFGDRHKNLEEKSSWEAELCGVNTAPRDELHALPTAAILLAHPPLGPAPLMNYIVYLRKWSESCEQRQIYTFYYFGVCVRCMHVCCMWYVCAWIWMSMHMRKGQWLRSDRCLCLSLFTLFPHWSWSWPFQLGQWAPGFYLSPPHPAPELGLQVHFSTPCFYVLGFRSSCCSATILLSCTAAAPTLFSSFRDCVSLSTSLREDLARGHHSILDFLIYLSCLRNLFFIEDHSLSSLTLNSLSSQRWS